MEPKLPHIVCSFLLVLLFASFTNVLSQDLSVGADLVSRYIWRGSDLGSNTPSIQPNVELGISGLTVGFWGAYSFSNSDALEEIDFYANYSLELQEAGSFSLGVTDYTNPNNGIRLGNFNNYNNSKGPGAHSVEMNATYTGPESLPLSLSFNMFLYNVEKNPVYVELGYTTSIKDVELKTFLGATPGDKAAITLPDGGIEYNSYYGVQKFSVINVGFTATKTVKITDSFSIPIFGSVILNPAAENAFYVLGVSF